MPNFTRYASCCLWLAFLCFATSVTLADEPEKKANDEQTLELLKTFRNEFVAITPGRNGFPSEFQMGRAAGGSESERPVHEVRFDYDFAIAKYEVPQNLWTAVMGSNPSRWKGPRNSVEELTYDDAVEFCEKVTRMLQSAELIDADQQVRLPSEAEWEYCARAGTKTVYSFGDDAADLDAYGWHTGNAAGNDPPVGAKKPNDWKLYDVHGYLWEWCADHWHADYEGAPKDGSAWTTGGDKKLRVLRSGSWRDPATSLTSTHRISAERTSKSDAIGLRCVLARTRSAPAARAETK